MGEIHAELEIKKVRPSKPVSKVEQELTRSETGRNPTEKIYAFQNEETA